MLHFLSFSTELANQDEFAQIHGSPYIYKTGKPPLIILFRISDLQAHFKLSLWFQQVGKRQCQDPVPMCPMLPLFITPTETTASSFEDDGNMVSWRLWLYMDVLYRLDLQ